MNDQDFIKRTIETSRASAAGGGFPVGAVIVIDGKLIAEGISDGKRLHDATSHAEITAIREASKKLGTRDLKDAVMYSSLEPCLMCFAACYWAGFSTIVYACRKDKVSRQHYEGLHDLEKINEANNHQMKLIHSKEMEEEALKEILDWESTINRSHKK